MNFERQKLPKISLYRFRKILKLRSFQVRVHFHPGHSQPDTFVNSFCAISTGLLHVR